MRMTYRTALVLEAIAQAPGISNLGVARHAQVNDQGQISKMLSRLERNGLVQNTGRGQTQGAPNEWRLTPAGPKGAAGHPRAPKAGRMMGHLFQPGSAQRPLFHAHEHHESTQERPHR